MEAPRRGNGQDFSPTAPYRMYHGTKIPGFPQHPHRGFETVTATIDGLIDHADSLGNCGRYGDGDLQWMTAGAGCAHSEMFPLLKENMDNPTRFFQIWLNLPGKDKMAEPGFSMFWADTIKKWSSPDGKASVTLWAGDHYFESEENVNSPPTRSWAASSDNDVAIFHITVQPGGKMTLPKARLGDEVNRSLFFVEGESQKMSVDGKLIADKVVLTVNAGQDIELEMDENANTAGEFLLLQGKPIKEPVKQHGPFVMNTDAEIETTFKDYQRTRFGGWPWPRDDMVFPAEEGRFAKVGGEETRPNTDGTCKK
jgi:redox-sensitive bicupin YhaK (pirin superfamily)